MSPFLKPDNLNILLSRTTLTTITGSITAYVTAITIVSYDMLGIKGCSSVPNRI